MFDGVDTHKDYPRVNIDEKECATPAYWFAIAPLKTYIISIRAFFGSCTIYFDPGVHATWMPMLNRTSAEGVRFSCGHRVQ